jgi:hypothetical protein
MSTASPFRYFKTSPEIVRFNRTAALAEWRQLGAA